MPLSYESIHWGDAPSGDVDARYHYGASARVGEIAKLGYSTRKGGEWGVYEHEFSTHEGRGPYLYRQTRSKNPSVRLENPGLDQSIEIGRLVDVTLKDGRRIVFGDAAVATTADGKNLVIVSEHGVPYQIEPRDAGHFVTNEGIEE